MLLKYENIVYDTENDRQLDDLIDDVLNGVVSDHDIAEIWNEYCDKVNYPEDHVYSMDFLEDFLTMTDTTAYDVITGNVIDPDCFCYQENWFIDSIWGLRSGNTVGDLIDFDDDGFRAYFEELLINDPEKYDCEEVDEEE